MDFAGAVFLSPKPGHSFEEYEDAWEGPARINRRIRAAVADGATETIYSGRWARLLARAFVDFGPDVLLHGEHALHSIRLAWQAGIREETMAAPWYIGAMADRGAFAAVLGLEIEESGNWTAVCVGDCCLFHIRDGALVRSWPFDQASDFGFGPSLLGSLPSAGPATPEIARGMAHSGDRFLLATDSAAAHLLAMPRDLLLACAAGTVGEIVVSEPRPRSDDLTLLQIELLGTP